MPVSDKGAMPSQGATPRFERRQMAGLLSHTSTTLRRK